ncbi:MAG: symmetrical bis(5'-nucleosyl)-tetraphosphatase [Gammaproteobacteria bacterium]|nr:symmetrical bis(5'-nucleosyl)-tetraphosphatase [Gammaproteobacteria bacterium]
MAIYAIGDVQGCYDSLRSLLDVIRFNEHNDQLWFVGDLVNRGPKSLETLRFIKNLGNAAVCILGNHDLHLLAASCTSVAENTRKALTLILQAKDRDELIDWLRHRSLLHHDGGYAMVHAGISPQWDLNQAINLAREVETVLQGNHFPLLMKAMYGNKPDRWSPQLAGMDRLRYIINSFTRMRYCDKHGRLDLEYNGPPGSQPKHLLPWFKTPGRKTINSRIVFGHWSSLGYYEDGNCYAIDTGCLWGGQLTALRLTEQAERFSVACANYKRKSA